MTLRLQLKNHLHHPPLSSPEAVFGHKSLERWEAIRTTGEMVQDPKEAYKMLYPLTCVLTTKMEQVGGHRDSCLPLDTVKQLHLIESTFYNGTRTI
jgi:hypothetical protein